MDTLSEEQVIDGFHLCLQISLAQATAQTLLDAATVASDEAAADLMISGPALALYYGALYSTTDPPSVPIPSMGLPMVRLSCANCPPAFVQFVHAWASAVPAIRALPPRAQHDLARVICSLTPLSHPPHPDLSSIAAELRAVASEISQRRTFQERYQADLQATINAGSKLKLTAHFVPPPVYDDAGDLALPASGSRTPDPEPQDEPPPPPWEPVAAAGTAAPVATDPAMALIYEMLYASLTDVIVRTPSLQRALHTDPRRAYTSCVALAILDVALSAVTPADAVRGALGRELILDASPAPLPPLIHELGAITREAARYAAQDDEDAMRLSAQGESVPEPRMDSIRKTLESGVGYDEHGRGWSADERSTEEREVVLFADRVNALALTMTELPAFHAFAQDVFEVLGAVS